MELTTHWSQIERLQGCGNTEAWRWFIDRYRDFAAMVLRKLIWSPDGASQASDEFWGYLFESGAVERLQRPMRFRGFLTSTLRNYALHWMRRNPRRPRVADPGVFEDRGMALLEDEEMAMWARQVLHLSLQRLEHEHPRWGWMMRAFYGLPAAAAHAEAPTPQRATEIAVELGCTANALHQLLFRARQRLRECVVEEVRQTVSTRQDFASELSLMLAALGRATPGLVAPSPVPDEERP